MWAGDGEEAGLLGCGGGAAEEQVPRTGVDWTRGTLLPPSPSPLTLDGLPLVPSSAQADIVILDAARIADGPVATIHLPHHLPASLHGSFSPEYLGPDPEDASVPRWKEPNQLRPL